MAELVLVRHGQASFGSENYDKLSPLGHQQSKWLGEYFVSREMHFDAAFCGDLVRHKETMSGIQSAFPKAPDHEILDGLNEFAFQNLLKKYVEQHPDQAPSDKNNPKEIYRLLKNAMRAWMQNEITGELPETWADFERRVADSLSHFQKYWSGKKVLVVSSGGAIAMAISQILNTAKETVIELNLQQKNSGFAHCHFNERSIRLTGFNFVPHLDIPERLEHITYS